MSGRVLRGDKPVLPIDLVRLFKYYRQFEDKTRKFRVPFGKVRASRDYAKRKGKMDRLFKVLGKYLIDAERYVSFCARTLGCQDPSDMARVDYISKYADHLRRTEQYRNIVHNFRRSARNLAKMCIEHKTTPQEEMSRIAREGRLGYEYVSGRLSKYFIASIGNFGKIYERLDPISKDELRILYNVADELNQDVQRAFLMYEKRQVAPMRLAAETIRQLNHTTENQEENDDGTVQE